ncbi:hypothetical protein EVAR_5497_1 [Eumeta japonica]|uniref:Uncharacterized protein n=1 Tax=Eumeta variegata TaxID=151549 RepID=A0A4C1TC94_EUMVA|nr:hypothetical protein EVAR_5497_1 [Eumeta japonica]
MPAITARRTPSHRPAPRSAAPRPVGSQISTASDVVSAAAVFRRAEPRGRLCTPHRHGIFPAHEVGMMFLPVHAVVRCNVGNPFKNIAVSMYVQVFVVRDLRTERSERCFYEDVLTKFSQWSENEAPRYMHVTSRAYNLPLGSTQGSIWTLTSAKIRRPPLTGLTRVRPEPRNHNYPLLLRNHRDETRVSNVHRNIQGHIAFPPRAEPAWELRPNAPSSWDRAAP